MAEVKAAKHLGQHFLTDPFIINEMLGALSPKETDNIIEIGPGLGAFTLPVLSKCLKMTAIELDSRVIPILKKKAEKIGELTLIEQDFLKFDLSVFSQMRLIGNLPYNLSSPIIFHCLQYYQQIVDMHFMLQKEVVDRIVAQPGSKTYGRLSIMTQLFCECSSLFDIEPEAFDPPPKVRSSFLRMIPRKKLIWEIDNFDLFSNIVKMAFSQRRKMIRKSLVGWITPNELQALDIADTMRPEMMSGADFAHLSNYLHRKNHNM